jgi:nucleotide-binding universal stress UspA family protein
MKRVLVCVDGSAYSQVCCRYAAWLAQRAGYEVEGVYVSDVWQYETSFLSDLSGSLGIQPYEAMLSQLEAVEEQKSKSLETAQRALLKQEGYGGTFTFHHRTGSVVATLSEFEEGPEGVSLLMMGKRGEGSNLETEHLGATMERLVRASTQPCIVTPRAYAPPQRALLAYDGSPSANKALHWLVQANGFKDLALHLVAVARQAGDAAGGRLQEGEGILRAGGWKPVCQVLSGEPGDAIAGYVTQQGIDFLIMGAYGHSAIRRLIIGSTTTDLIRRCHVPVMLFR